MPYPEAMGILSVNIWSYSSQAIPEDLTKPNALPLFDLSLIYRNNNVTWQTGLSTCLHTVKAGVLPLDLLNGRNWNVKEFI